MNATLGSRPYRTYHRSQPCPVRGTTSQKLLPSDSSDTKNHVGIRFDVHLVREVALQPFLEQYPVSGRGCSSSYFISIAHNFLKFQPIQLLQTMLAHFCLLMCSQFLLRVAAHGTKIYPVEEGNNNNALVPIRALYSNGFTVGTPYEDEAPASFESEALSGGAIAGIIIMISVLHAILVACIALVAWKKKKRQQTEDAGKDEVASSNKDEEQATDNMANGEATPEQPSKGDTKSASEQTTRLENFYRVFLGSKSPDKDKQNPPTAAPAREGIEGTTEGKKYHAWFWW